MPGSSTPPKYPRTPYLPYSPSIAPDSDRLADPSRFVGEPVVVTEKLDGSCTVHRGTVYTRSVSAPTSAKWMAMAKKHHAWKVAEPDIYLYGEGIFGVHSIEYEPVAEDETFYAFALRVGNDRFASFRDMVHFAGRRQIPVVPVLFDGVFRSESKLRSFVDDAHGEPSALGGEREGVVVRLAGSFRASDFGRSVCKSVRAGHVQTDEHWTKHWKPCRLARRS
ncbi:MAG: RNA ligase family protein [Acidobacteria bacterium]|nr:RNA ligase family protein [Acidobacteriota bacterium]